MRILFIGETASIHTSRWINQLPGTGWDVDVFQALPPGSSVCPDLSCSRLYLPYRRPSPSGVDVRLTVPTDRMAGKVLFRLCPGVVPEWHIRSLVRVLKTTRPDVVHSLGLNINWRNQCGPVLEAKRRMGPGFPRPWIYSSWGSDLDFYARMSDRQKAEAGDVLLACDGYISECDRDLRLAKELGFKGQFLGKFPAFGGMDADGMGRHRLEGPVSSRRTVFLKGRDCHGEGGDPVGRAITAMNAFRRCKDVLSGCRIAIGQASQVVTDEAHVLVHESGLTVNVLPTLSHEALLRIVGTSRIFVALTVNDGLPASLVEAMALGVFPIHSDLEPIREWIKDGENGLLFPADDPGAVALAVRRAMTDDAMVNRAAEINAGIIRDRLDERIIRPKVIEMYENAAKLMRESAKESR